MDWQKIIEQSIAMLFPLIIVFVFVYYMLKSFFDQFEKQRQQELRVKFSEETLPLRLQAYERLTLFLERIKPESMIIRVAFKKTLSKISERNMNTIYRNRYMFRLKHGR